MYESIEYNSDIPYPFLYNILKHHLAHIHEIIKCYSLQKSERVIMDLKEKLCTIGENLIDVYFGKYYPVEICKEISKKLIAMELLERDIFENWINNSEKQYKVLTIADSSQWTLRIGKEEDRYIHIHPGKRSPHTMRVRANTLKSAIAVSIAAQTFNKETISLEFINAIRSDWLSESPIKNIDPKNGLGAILHEKFNNFVIIA